jgi:hypothetical protein
VPGINTRCGNLLLLWLLQWHALHVVHALCSSYLKWRALHVTDDVHARCTPLLLKRHVLHAIQPRLLLLLLLLCQFPAGCSTSRWASNACHLHTNVPCCC